MDKPSTHKYQRIVIWVITAALVVGTLGAYFIVILQNSSKNNTQSASQTATDTSTKQEDLPVDPTAYKVEGKVTQLQVVDEKVGTGAGVKEGDNVRVHYKGTIAQTGAKFDSSYDRGEPATFSLSRVIPGWSQGMQGMQVGGKRRMIIPSDLAYGAQGNGPVPANADLVFEVELLAINPAE